MLLTSLLSIIAGILYGLTESLNKSVVEKKYSSFSYALIQWSGNTFLYFIPFIFFKESLPSELNAYILLGILVIILFIGNLCLIQAYKTEDISNINILSRASLIISFLSGILLLAEDINTYKILGISLIITGILIILYEGKKLHLSIGFIFAIAAGLAIGMVAYVDKLALELFTPISLLFIYNLISAAVFTLIPKARKDLIPIVRKYPLKIIASRLSAVTAFYLFIYAIEKGNISIVNTNFESFYLVATAFIGIAIFKERKNIKNKIIGAIICGLGIILLNIF